VSLFRETRSWWQERSARQGFSATFFQFVEILKEFGRESTPASRRQRYGDVEFDWDHRVDTTGATVSWSDRFVGHLHSAYQPTEPAAFHEMMALAGIDFPQFTFIDIGSGKGRVLLMAADYPFNRVMGVELLPALHRIAQQNISKYGKEPRRCSQFESVCQNAVDFDFPEEPLVVYLFNPLGEVNLMKLVSNLNQSLTKNPRPAYVLYHNALLEHVLLNAGWRKLRDERYFSLFSFVEDRS
jgi:SAM-dependent methyltransferase